MDLEERSVRRARGYHCEFAGREEVHLVVELRGEVGGVHFGKVHSAKFPWYRGKGEDDDEMMSNNRFTHAPGVKSTAPTSTRRTSNTAVSDWQQDAEARMGPAGLGEEGNKEGSLWNSESRAGDKKSALEHGALQSELVKVHSGMVGKYTRDGSGGSAPCTRRLLEQVHDKEERCSCCCKTPVHIKSV